MSDHFYDHGNEYCRYLITDPRSDRSIRKKSKKEIQNMAIAAYLQARDDAGLTEQGLWANIHKRRKSGKKMRKPGEKGAPTKAAFKSASESVEEGKAGKKKKPEPWPKQWKESGENEYENYKLEYVADIDYNSMILYPSHYWHNAYLKEDWFIDEDRLTFTGFFELIK